MSDLTQMHTDVGGPVLGDCWRTAIACLLDLDHPGDVPHFVEIHRDDEATSLDWWEASKRFVETARPGVTLECYAPTFPVYDGDWPSRVIASGPSPRGPFAHSVLVHAKDGTLAWDPHPSRAGLAGPPTDIAVLIPRDDD